MQAEFIRRCSLCLVQKKEVAPFLQELKKSHPNVEMALFEQVGAIELMFQAEEPVDFLIERVQEKFPGFFFGEGRIEEVLHREFIQRKKTLALAESCTGGRISERLTALPDASRFLLGSIVAYSNAFKERFLHVRKSTLDEKGAVSIETVKEMVQGLFQETDADYAAAVSGIAGPKGGSASKPVGTVYLAIAKRGEEIDAGVIQAGKDRSEIITHTTQLLLGGLWRRLVHKEATFS